ncbi:sugar phosphate isomerase/epimerase [Microbacterium sp. SLBN-146]|uniref:sugar phosphate isomerase/epimerase family protein n=1 Tax=Microbacterium sp. SLBN-146 TaxID=2768457 RepID=UPI0011548B6B|nr:TIM barrel protein [Microbacterium sp. SLBN-146]TQJ29899.1 sugar phosphate isomerase/epimerase [Microbacterium sp. SLBN-146]
MYTVLSTRRLLFDASPERLVSLGETYGFDAVDAFVPFFRDPGTRERFVRLVSDAGLRFGLAGLPVPLGTKTSDDEFEDLIGIVEDLAPALADAGATTVSAWLAPANDELPFEETLDLHRRRLDALAPLLRANGLRLALEYVGPATWRAPYRYPFISDLDGMRSLIASLDDPGSFGLLLDTFHWYTAGETLDQIAALDPTEILAVDLNDAPQGVDRDAQLDMERAQPGATGVIDADGFVEVLTRIGYTGPVQSEPFSTHLRTQPEEERVVDARAALTRVGVPS